MSELLKNTLTSLTPADQEDKKYEFSKTTKDSQDPINPRPVITKIRIGQELFNVGTPKDWEENRPGHRAYIHGRTHFKGQVIYVAENDPLLTNLTEAQYLDFPYAIQVVKSGEVKATKEFKNTYNPLESGGKLQTTDRWQVAAPWFNDRNIGLTYKLSIDYKSQLCTLDAWEYPSEATAYALTTGAICSSEDSVAMLIFDPKTTTFEIKNEDSAVKNGTECDTKYPVSVANSITIEPLLTTSLNSPYIYAITHTFDAEFAPIDHNSIRQDASGLLYADIIFKNDFQVTEQFGKYPPKSWVSAAGKTTNQVIYEAFCEDVQPGKVAYPFIDFTAVPDSPDACYERGATATINWELQFNPGKYSYGTKNGNDSNLYVSRIGFDSSENVAAYHRAAGDPSYTLSLPDGSTIAASRDETTSKVVFGTNAEAPLYDPTDTEGCYNKNTYKVATGRIQVQVKGEGTQGTLRANVKYHKEDLDYSVSVLGNKSTPLLEFEINNDSAIESEQAKFDISSSNIGEIFGVYRWFYGYANANTLLNPTAWTASTSDPTVTEIFRGFHNQGHECPLGQFPTKITTYQMQQLFFAAPAGRVSNFRVINARTGANAGVIRKLAQPVYIADASYTANNDYEFTDEDKYDIFFVSNAVADSGTNTYELIYSTSNKGGIS